MRSEMRIEDNHLRILRAMTPEQRLRAAEELYDFARELKSAVLAQEHPDWSAEQVRRTVNEWFLYARN